MWILYCRYGYAYVDIWYECVDINISDSDTSSFHQRFASIVSRAKNNRSISIALCYADTWI